MATPYLRVANVQDGYLDLSEIKTIEATFLGLAKTCTKLGISFWDYLGARLNLLGAAVPPLANLILARTQPP